ncbi:MAG TPA: hypothetical protein PLB02_01500 [Thermoanaerobaculia bacterium]|nr:hypothetical protein [Thermoanaerobaculia bacterium]
MSKQALSVTLDPENILWLKARSRGTKARSVSETLDRLLSEARTGRATAPKPRSVRGAFRLDPADPDLKKADEAVRELFRASISRTLRSLGRPARTRG